MQDSNRLPLSRSMQSTKMESPYGEIKHFLFLMTLISFPLYFFSSGSLQLSHIFALTFAGLVLMTRRSQLPNWANAYLGLTIYVSFVEVFYMASNYGSGGVINAAYYFFNFMVLISVYNFFKDRGLKFAGLALAVSISIAFIGVVIGGIGLTVDSEGSRSIGTFNNPNQLGYFSVCAGSLAFLLNRINMLGNLGAITLIVVSAFLAIVSLSKAAIISQAFLLIFLIFPRRITSGRILSMMIGLTSGFYILIYLFLSGYFDKFIFFNRIVNMQSEADSSLIERGYLAFLDGSFLQIIFGLGEINVRAIVGHEVHSTIGSAFNNYGLIGFILLMYVLLNWAVKIWNTFGFVALCGVCGPPMLYGITHNGTRFTIFWILIGLSFAVTRRSRMLASVNPLCQDSCRLS